MRVWPVQQGVDREAEQQERQGWRGDRGQDEEPYNLHQRLDSPENDVFE